MAGCTIPSQEVPLAAFHLVFFFWHVQLWWPTRSQASSWKSCWVHSRHSRNHAVSKYNEKQRNVGKRKLGISCDWDINRTIVYYSTFYDSNQDQRFCLLSSYENLIWIKLSHVSIQIFCRSPSYVGFSRTCKCTLFSSAFSSPFTTWIISVQVSLDFVAYCLFWSHKKSICLWKAYFNFKVVLNMSV